MQHYDVVVVGAGPAGSSAALAASCRGISVLVVEKSCRAGLPVQCAEYVPRGITRFIQPGPGTIVQRVDQMHTFIHGKQVHTMNAPGYILDRSVFDADLLTRAAEAGARVWFEARAVELIPGGIKIKNREGKTDTVACDCIIGADGPRSTVGEWIGCINQKFMLGVQETLPLTASSQATEIYFDPDWRGGYAWLFPRGKEANVGLGVSLDYHDKAFTLLEDFINRLKKQGKLQSTKAIRRTAGLIPVSGPVTDTCTGNLLLAGDAAGHTHPVSGGGIMNAIIGGSLAGKAAARAIQAKDSRIWEDYPRLWKEYLGQHLTRGLEHRKRLDSGWTSNPDDFVRLVRETWMAFRP